MGAEHAMPWPPFGGRRGHRGWAARARWMGMVAGRDWMGMAGPGRGRGRPGPRQGGGPFGFWGDPRGSFGPPFGQPFMPPFRDPRGHRHFWGSPRVRRGDVRAAVLALLVEEPRNGYQLIQEINERSGGVWRPSAGSVYPALQQLEDEGLVRAVESGARRLFELTDEGQTYVEAHADELAAPWDAVSGSVGEQAIELRNLMAQVGSAAIQVMQAGSASQVAEMRRTLDETRRSLYRILAEGESAGSAKPADPADPHDSAASPGDARENDE